MLGLHRPHLQRAIAQGKVRPPRLIRVGGASARLWTRMDVERARKQLLKFKPTNGRRKKKKSKK